MRNEMYENMGVYFQRMLPLITSILLLLISYIPLNFSLSNNMRPAMGMICVYFWMIHRPDLFNLVSVYILGLFDDIISSVPMGSNILALLVLYLLVNNLQHFFNGKPFIITWYGFATLSLATFCVKWLVVSIYYGQFLPLSILFFTYLVTIAFYPFISLINAFVQNTLIRDEE